MNDISGGSGTLRALLRRAWWHLRFFGHAAMHREFEDPRVQALVREEMVRLDTESFEVYAHRIRLRLPKTQWPLLDRILEDRADADYSARLWQDAAERLSEALIRCAEIAGVDGESVEAARSGALKHPPISEFALQAVEQLRKDYDDA